MMQRHWICVAVVVAGGCAIDPDAGEFQTTSASLQVAGPLRGFNSEAYDEFGWSLAMSADGSTIAVGAIGENGDGRGIDPPDINSYSPWAGAVYIFRNVDGSWVQEAYVKASNTRSYNWFGTSVALSADGSTLAVGAPGESGASTGVNGDQQQGLGSAGAVYVYVRKPSGWSQQAYIKPHRLVGANFGTAVSLSFSGDTLAVGEPQDCGPDPMDGSQTEIGSVYVFARTGSVWRQDTYLQAAVPDYQDMLGSSLAVSPDGSQVAAAAANEASGSTGVQGNQHDNSAPGSGAVYIFARNKKQWRQDAYIKASNTDTGDGFGHKGVAFSPDGQRLAVGASLEASAAVGVDGDQLDNSTRYAGAVYLFGLNGSHWSQSAYVKASDTHIDNQFGYSVALSSSSLIVGAVGWANEDPPGVTGGTAYGFSLTSTAQTDLWQSPNPWNLGQFGRNVATDASGHEIAVSSIAEENIGSVYVFHKD